MGLEASVIGSGTVAYLTPWPPLHGWRGGILRNILVRPAPSPSPRQRSGQATGEGWGGGELVRSEVAWRASMWVSLPITLLLLSGCVVDTSVPPDSQLSCSEDAHCPSGWWCDPAADLCRAPGYQAPVQDTTTPETTDDAGSEIPRYEEKRALCAALYDEAADCEDAIRATLSDEIWALLSGERAPFVDQTCPGDLLATFSDEELDDLLALGDLIALATCPMLAQELCDFFTAEAGFETSCP